MLALVQRDIGQAGQLPAAAVRVAQRLEEGQTRLVARRRRREVVLRLQDPAQARQRPAHAMALPLAPEVTATPPRSASPHAEGPPARTSPCPAPGAHAPRWPVAPP